MPKFYIKMRVDFSGEIEAESEADAESKSWTLWGDEAGAEIGYDGVYSIDVEEIEEDEDDEEEEDDE